MRSLTLYQISSEYEFLANDLCDPETGVVNDATLARLSALEDSMENKCINITRLFKSLEATQEAIKVERDRMAAREKALKNQVERLKDYLSTNMDRCDIKKIECPQFTIALQKNPPAVIVDDETLIPVTYDKFKIEKDMAKIREDLQKGIEIPGVRLVQGKSIRIR